MSVVISLRGHGRADAMVLDEVCVPCGVSPDFVAALVNEGAVIPAGNSRIERRHWRFDPRAVRRVRRAHRLMRDLHVNLPGVALALDLLERLERQRHTTAF